jgi:murein L,D-transpeptidase YafK
LLLTGVLAFAACTPAAEPEIGESRAAAAERRVRPALDAALEEQGLRLGAPVFLRITKDPAELAVFLEGSGGDYALFRTYPVCAFSGELGPKFKEGDRQAPEGFYAVSPAQMNPNSDYHLSFDLGFPNARDRADGRTGSFLMVHGACVSIGCYAMTDPVIEEIWTLMVSAQRAGQAAVPVHAFPFVMTAERLAKEAASPHLAFWRDELKPGWDAFAQTKRPPRMEVQGGRYVVSAIN